MMSKQPGLGTWLALLVALLTAVGCSRPTASLELTSYKDPYFPETYEIELADCAYYVGPDGDYHIVGRAAHSPEKSNGGTVEQFVHAHLFWKPWPGKTFAHPTTVDATIRYAIVTEQGTAVYCGTGFVYPKKRRLTDGIIARVEQARLRLESQVGDAPELIGAARLAGKLVAEDNPCLAVDLRRQLELHAGRPPSQ
jgi:hypothetical protein